VFSEDLAPVGTAVRFNVTLPLATRIQALMSLVFMGTIVAAVIESRQ